MLSTTFTVKPLQEESSKKEQEEEEVMEFVPFTTEQLSYLAKQDPCLAPIFEGVFAADELPGLPEQWKKRAYIVNTDPIDKPGSHWLGIFTKKHTCEVFDSYRLPLNWYKPSDVVEWVFENFETVSSNAMTLQEMNSQSCGQYALMYSKAKARGQIIDDFRSLFKKGDFVHNDHLVGQVIKPLLTSRVRNLKYCKQDNGRSCPLDI